MTNLKSQSAQNYINNRDNIRPRTLLHLFVPLFFFNFFFGLFYRPSLTPLNNNGCPSGDFQGWGAI